MIQTRRGGGGRRNRSTHGDPPWLLLALFSASSASASSAGCCSRSPVYALPFLAGLTAGLAAFQGGSGLIGALIVGALIGAAILAIGQVAFATARTPLIRISIGLVYAVPAAVAGYQLSLGTRRHRRARRKLATGFCRRRCCSCWRHGLRAHGSDCPAGARAARSCGRRGSGGRCLAVARLQRVIASSSSSSNTLAKWAR